MLSLRRRIVLTSENETSLYPQDNPQEDLYETKLKKNMMSSPDVRTWAVDTALLGFMTLGAILLRWWIITTPSVITVVELEMTHQIQWYLKGQFFIGKCPPLAGLFYSTIAHAVGYTGNNPMYYAGQYIKEMPVLMLRNISAVMGASIIPMSYFTVLWMGHSRLSAVMVGGLLMIESGMITQSHFVSPEGLLCVLSVASFATWSLMHKYQDIDSLKIAWGYQALTGVFIGCALSTKWQGIAPWMALWGATANSTWKCLVNQQKPISAAVKHMASHVLTLGVLPVAVYLSIFYLHFTMLPNSGDHDLLISPQLKYSLQGNIFSGTQKDIFYGSKVVLRHFGTAGGYIHSFNERYKTGSTQQIVTVYPYEDINNIWVIQKAQTRWNSSQPLEPVKTNDPIRLEHYASGRKLHSHDHRPPVSSRTEYNEVSAYGDPYLHDGNDIWWARVLNDENKVDPNDTTPITALTTRLRFLHSRGCYLMSHNVPLPEPALEQQEIACMVSANKELSTFIIESAYHEASDADASFMYEPLSFWSKLKQVHQLMANYPTMMHDRLSSVPLSDTVAPFGSVTLQPSPLSYFFQKNTFLVWDELSGRSMYLVFNSALRWMTLIAMGVFGGTVALQAMLQKRQMAWSPFFFIHSPLSCSEKEKKTIGRLHNDSLYSLATSMACSLLGLCLLPKHTQHMGDLLPCIYLSILFCVIAIEAVISPLARGWRYTVCIAALVICTISFLGTSSIVFATPWTQTDCMASSLKTLDCQRFPMAPDLLEEKNRESLQRRTFQVDIPGKKHSMRYVLGDEERASEIIEDFQLELFLEEVDLAPGIQLYHRAVSTVPPSFEESREWGSSIASIGYERSMASKEKKEKKEKKKAKRKEKKKKDIELASMTMAANSEDQVQQENRPRIVDSF
ncbi:hypothetical protein BDF14DRAFT_688193 [Spinellus fusiger]|nr:hypothetical protein BDF14DRAFT_688193 [Spinellus fusiger]